MTTGNPPTPPDADARARALDPRRSFIVRAPAGSGKTTLLIQRYLSLLTRVARPEEILCMTFTRKAAGEMRSRVLAALRSAERDGEGAGDTLHDLACKALAHGRRHEWHLLRNPSRLQFHTIDGWCARLVRQMPRASSFGAAPSVEEVSETLYRRAAAAALAHMDDGDGVEAQAARAVLAHFDNNHEQALGLVAAMLAVRDQWLDVAAIPDLSNKRAMLERYWHVTVSRRLAAVRDAVESLGESREIVTCASVAARNLHADGATPTDGAAPTATATRTVAASPVLACLDLSALPPATPDALPQWRGLRALLLTGDGYLRKTVNKRDGFPPSARDEKARMVTLLKRLRAAADDATATVTTDAATAAATTVTTAATTDTADADDVTTVTTAATATAATTGAATTVTATAAATVTAAVTTATAPSPAWVMALDGVRGLPAPRYEDGHWEILGALLTLLKQAAAWLDLDIGDSGRCDHIAVARGAVAALGEPDNPTDLALSLDHRIMHILVDEFQDTSESQLRLLEMLTAGWDGSDPRTLFLVGDPQQSIYAFRRADVGIYLDAVERGIGHLKPEKVTLSANFRSRRPLVAWVNRVFQEAMPPTSDPESGAVSFERSAVVHDDDDTAGVTFHACPAGEASDEEAAAVVDAVRRERAHDADATVAILARSRTHLPAILHRLKAAGVPYQEVGLEPLAHRPLAQDLLALTCALLHPADRTAWLAVLRAPWCGLDLHDLAALSHPDATPWERARDPAVAATVSSAGRERLARLTPAVERALAQRGRLPPARWIEQTWWQLGGAALVDRADWPDARLFFDRLRVLCGPTGFHEYRALREGLEGVRSVAGGVAGEASSNPVRVMTMHGAKGLEFDVVLIPGLARGVRPDARRVMAWHKYRAAEHEETPLLLAPLNLREDDDGHVDNDMYNYVRALDKRRGEFEDGRLLYVACTRARRRLHVFATLTVKEDDDGTRLLSPAGSLLSRVATPCADELERALAAWHATHAAVESPPDATARSARTTEAQTRLCRVPDGWRAPPPLPAIPTVSSGDDADDEAKAWPTFRWAERPARLAGILAHRALCVMAEQGVRVWDAERVRGRREAWVAELGAQGVDAATSRRVAADVERALCFSLDDPTGRWILDDAHHDARNEYRLSGMVGGRLVRRTLDRTMVDGDGTRWIIDYKTGAHRGGDLDGFLDDERERYRAQLDGYAALMSRMTDAPIRLGLYFPLAGGWREWAWDGGGAGREGDEVGGSAVSSG